MDFLSLTVLIWFLKKRIINCDTFIFEFESLSHQALLLFNNLNREIETPQYTEVKKHLKYVKKTYLNGSHATVEEISYYDRFQHKSNNDCEAINKMKNRMAKKAARNGIKTSKHFIYCFLLTQGVLKTTGLEC